MFGFVKEDTYLELLEEKTDLEQENDLLRETIAQKDKAIMELRYKRGGDGNAVLRQEAAKAFTKYNELCIEVGNLKGQVAELSYERDYWKQRCLGIAEITEAEPKKTSSDDFQSREDGLKTKDVQMKCFEMRVDGDEAGNDPAETMADIAEKFGISYSVVPSYVSKGKAHYKSIQIELARNINGRITRKKFPISQIDDSGKLHSDTAWSIDFNDLSMEEWLRILKYYRSSTE